MVFNYQKRYSDFVLLFGTRILRMLSYGMLSVVFFNNLIDKGIDESQIGWVQSAIVFGDIFISLVLTTQADKIGRINTLMFGALLKLITGVIYAKSDNIYVLTIAGILGVISVSGGEIGPFMPIEQSALSHLVEECTTEKNEIAKNVSLVFGYYNMAGYISQAFGAISAGFYIKIVGEYLNLSAKDATTNIVLFYALFGFLKFLGYYLMDRSHIEAEQPENKQIINCTGIHSRNYQTILYLSALFAMDAFAGGFVIQSYISYYYEAKYGLFFDKIGAILFVCNIISGISGVLSSKLVDRFGAMATMIYTHLPSNIFLLAIAFTNNSTVSIILLFARFCISQMDVPARQTYVSMVVSSQQRSAANGITNIARSVGLSLGLGFSGYFLSFPTESFQFSYPFLISGAIKIVYDITIGCCFLWNKKQESHREEIKSIEVMDHTVTEKEEESS